MRALFWIVEVDSDEVLAFLTHTRERGVAKMRNALVFNSLACGWSLGTVYALF